MSYIQSLIYHINKVMKYIRHKYTGIKVSVNSNINAVASIIKKYVVEYRFKKKR